MYCVCKFLSLAFQSINTLLILNSGVVSFIPIETFGVIVSTVTVKLFVANAELSDTS